MKVKKRIELKDIKVYQSIIPDGNAGENPEISNYPDCGIEFDLEGENLNGHGPQQAAMITDENGKKHPAMGGWPEAEVAFTVSESDIPRVQAWFDDNYHDVTYPESQLLQKNRKTAVLNTLKTYFSTAAGSNLFTSPFRLGWRYRLSDGTFSKMHHTGVLSTFMEAPRLPVVSNILNDKYLHTRVQIRNVPARLRYRFNPNENFADYRQHIQFVEIYATKQVELYNPDGEVAGIRSIIIEGIPKRCWHYERYAENDVRHKAEQDNDFRMICSIPIDGVVRTDTFEPLPIPSGTLKDFIKLPKPDELPDDNNPSLAGKNIRIITEPLHIGYPENEKSVNSVTLRGVFKRDQVKIRLFASQHREQWHLIASSGGPYIRGIYGARWRWFKIEIESKMREGDFFEAIVVVFRL